jgi:hypothetical protein
MIPLAAVRPPPPEFRGTDKADFERQDAQRKAVNNACAPIVIENPAGHFLKCYDYENQRVVCVDYYRCQQHLRTCGRLWGLCEAALSRGYSREKPVTQDTLERHVRAAFTDGGWLSSTAIYDKVLPERGTMSEKARAYEERRVSYAIKRLRDKGLLEMRTPHDKKWTREYSLVEQTQ